MGDPRKSSGKSRDEIAAAYDSPSWWYDVRGFFILTFAYNSTLGHQLRFFGPNFGTQHIEVACGSGTLLQMMLRWRQRRRLPPSRVVAIDYAAAMIAGARGRFAGTPHVHVAQADAARLPYPDASFDTANVANSIHSLPDLDGALKDIFRVLKPGGTFGSNVLLYPRGPWPLNRIAGRINDWGMRKGILYTPYEREAYRGRVETAGFEVTADSVSGNCYDVLARKPA
jgi:ubiquinone/menaquinone biosynthesis C-methylase UbiE